MRTFQFSRSQISDFLRCRQRYYYGNIEGIEDTTPGSIPMRFGTLGHAGIAAGMEALMEAQQQGVEVGQEIVEHLFYNAGTLAMADLVRNQTYLYRDKLQQLRLTLENNREDIATCGAVFDYYTRRNAWNDYNRYKILAVEKRFVWYAKLKLASGEMVQVEIDGQFDWMAEDTTYTNARVLQVCDNKFVGNVNLSKKFLRKDVQMLVYELIAWDNRGDYDDVQMLYNMIRREVPPGYTLMDGTEGRSSKTKSGAKSTASVDPEDYYYRAELHHSRKQRFFIASNFLQNTLRQMVMAFDNPDSLQGNISPIKTGGESCDNCPFDARCSAELLGAGQPSFVTTGVGK